MRYTEEELQLMEDFEDEMMRIHENPLFYEDDINMDEIEVLPFSSQLELLQL